MNGLSIFTVLVVVGSTEARTITKGQGFKLQPVVAGFILGICLYIFDIINAELSTRLNVLVILAALLYNGSAIGDALTKATQHKKG